VPTCGIGMAYRLDVAVKVEPTVQDHTEQFDFLGNWYRSSCKVN